MFLLRKCLDYRSIKICLRLYSIGRKSHYDVLKLRKNCSDKEIKDAFIQMSKEYHPDKNKDVKAQEKFIRIVEAYNVLGKPSSRAQYDNISEISTGGASYVYRAQGVPFTYRNHTNHNYYYEHMRYKNNNKTGEKEKQSPNEWYYGFAGVKKLPNYYFILICFGIALFGVVTQFYVIRNMYTIQRNTALERSKYIAEELERVRTSAKDNGNELQTRLLLDKIVSAANPTVTTASLGQALANEKKDHIESLLTEFGISEDPDQWYDTNDASHQVNLSVIVQKLLSCLR